MFSEVVPLGEARGLIGALIANRKARRAGESPRLDRVHRLGAERAAHARLPPPPVLTRTPDLLALLLFNQRVELPQNHSRRLEPGNDVRNRSPTDRNVLEKDPERAATA